MEKLEFAMRFFRQKASLSGVYGQLLMLRTLSSLFFLTAVASAQLQFSGIYPHLVLTNKEGECGTGAVVPWADRLWVITYGPHLPKGSSDKLYEITSDLQKTVRPESIGGTPANRMIHEESQQLFIGPYIIDAKRNVRTIPYSTMFGRHTGHARHLTDPASKIVYATMEEGIYEVDVKTLAVTDLWIDEQLQIGGAQKKGITENKEGRKANLPGYHGKGFYSAQGRYVYSNNGEHGNDAKVNPRTPSGVLAEWDGKAEKWTVVRRNQFTEVTGPGGIMGKAESPDAPLWSVGWDHRSLILMCLHQGKWTAYRLPKGSHSYDGAHGWNTEWPRIRDIGEKDFLMTMHGTFWKFPKNFTPASSAGIAPRSNYLKVIGDFCEWNGKVVFGCDDTAKSEFLNKRSAKGEIAPPRSQSNLWFASHETLDQLGTPIGCGSVWLQDASKKDQASDAYLFAGYDHRAMHLVHTEKTAVDFLLEVDRNGDGTWSKFETISAAPGKTTVHSFAKDAPGVWIRVTPQKDCASVTAQFTYRNEARHTEADAKLFAGLAKSQDTTVISGRMRAFDDDALTFGYVATNADGSSNGLYVMNNDMKLTRKDDATLADNIARTTRMPEKAYSVDEASALLIDDKGRRWRFPRGAADYAKPEVMAKTRIAREVATERDLLNLCGTFYELPAENAGGFAMVRPVATHNLMIQDFCSWHGLFVLSGISSQATDNKHIIRSDDGKAAVWVGAIDDAWKLGKAVGEGGPWKNTSVKANENSDPYLMTGYDRKTLTLEADVATTVVVEVDISGYGDWVTYESLELTAGKSLQHEFPVAFSAYWVRFRSDKDAKISAQLRYE
jgi:hypothetical protein